MSTARLLELDRIEAEALQVIEAAAAAIGAATTTIQRCKEERGRIQTESENAAPAADRLTYDYPGQVIQGNLTAAAMLAPMEWDIVAAVQEKGETGIELNDLIPKVPRWKKNPPSPKAVDVAIQKLNKKLLKSGILYQIYQEKATKKNKRGRYQEKIYLFFRRLNI